MNYYYSFNSSLSISSSHSILPHFNPSPWRFHRTIVSSISGPFRRRSRRPRRRLKLNKTPTDADPYSTTSDSKLQVVIDIEDVSTKASLSLRRFLASSELMFDQFVYTGNEALRDLQSLITVDDDRRVLISCRPSTLHFLGNLVLCGCVIVLAFRVLVKLGLGFRDRLRVGYGGRLVTRRDRSLGGKEVVVGSRMQTTNDSRVSPNPVSRNMPSKSWVQRKENNLPNWWPMSPSLPPVTSVNKEEYQREANRLVRAIMDNRMSGKDISQDDIIQLRRICRTSGLRVYIDTTNVRDSVYRASVNYVLDHCSSVAGHSNDVQIDGENATQFVAAFAANIGLENFFAATIVSAAVAARTRSCFLQAWALEMQDKHYEAAIELSKICLIHQIFPPEECSAEMEMVARGLEKHLKVEQRNVLLNMLLGVCGDHSRRSLTEALGL